MPGPVQCLRSPDAPGLTSAWLPEPGGCSQCWLLPPPSACSSLSSPPPLETFTARHSPLQSSFLSWPWLLSPLHRGCAFTFSLAFSALPSPCCFPLLASALIGRLFLCANPTQARTAAVMPELSLTRRGLGCSSAPPTFPVISTFDRLGLWAAAAVDYRSISHLAHSVSATLIYKKHRR